MSRCRDIQALARPVLRHRVIPNFYAESERISADNLVERLLEAVPSRAAECRYGARLPLRAI